MSDFDLNAFLAEQRAEGISEGGGEFTISHQKAAQKMSQYSLPREHAWVLKFVQSAVAWGCNGITLRQTRNHSTFTFYTQEPERLPSNQEIVTTILRADPLSNDPISGFGAALRILVEKSCLSFLLRIERGTDVSPAIYAGVYYSDMGENNRVKQRAQWDGNLNLRIHHIPHTDPNRLLLNYIPVQDHALPILWELQKYAYLSPIPIIVDGRRIDGVLQETAGRWSIQRKPIRLCGCDDPGTSHPPFEICSDVANQVLSLYAPLAKAVPKSQDPTVHQFYVVISLDAGDSSRAQKSLSEGSFLRWIRDGVLVDEEKLNVFTQCLDLEIYASAQGLSSDLTGFQLRRNEEFLQRRSDALKAVVRVLESERAAQRDIFVKVEEEPQEPLETMGPWARTFFALTREFIRELTPVPTWEDSSVKQNLRYAYLRDLDSLIETQAGEAPVMTEVEVSEVSEVSETSEAAERPAANSGAAKAGRKKRSAFARSGPATQKSSAKEFSGRAGPKYVSPSHYTYEASPRQFYPDVKENTTFRWLPPEER